MDAVLGVLPSHHSDYGKVRRSSSCSESAGSDLREADDIYHRVSFRAGSCSGGDRIGITAPLDIIRSEKEFCEMAVPSVSACLNLPQPSWDLRERRQS